MDVKKAFKQLMAEKLGCDVSEIDDNARILDDLGVDSLEFGELIGEVEGTFNVTILDDDIRKIVTVQDCVAILERTIYAEENEI